MANISAHLPKKFTSRLFELFVPAKVSETDKFELVIRLNSKDISVRNLAAYLNFIDKSFGRLSPKGLTNYSRSSQYELRLTEIRHGSLEIVISYLLANPNEVTTMILIGLLLKYLPGIIKSGLSAYRDYEEGRLAKARRQQIKEQIKNEKKLSALKERQINQLCYFFDKMYEKYIRNLPKAYKFSKETVIEIKFNFPKSDTPIKKQNEVRNIYLKRKLDI